MSQTNTKTKRESEDLALFARDRNLNKTQIEEVLRRYIDGYSYDDLVANIKKTEENNKHQNQPLLW